jgi:protein-tyrosine phosphatase
MLESVDPSRESETPSKVFRILIVGTRNVSGSAMAERVLQAGLNTCSPGRFQVDSAGSESIAGSPMTPSIEGLVRVFGGYSEGFASRRLNGDMLLEHNLVLSMNRRQRSMLLELEPSMLRRTFTLLEFGRMVNTVTSRATPDLTWSQKSSERWEQLLLLALALRSELSLSVADDDFIDPFLRDDGVHSLMVRQLVPALDSLIEFECTASRMLR